MCVCAFVRKCGIVCLRMCVHVGMFVFLRSSIVLLFESFVITSVIICTYVCDVCVIVLILSVLIYVHCTLTYVAVEVCGSEHIVCKNACVCFCVIFDACTSE